MLVKMGKILCAKVRVFHIKITYVSSYSISTGCSLRYNSEVVVVDVKLNYTVPHKNVTFIFSPPHLVLFLYLPYFYIK